jgi:hypothetical protein
MGVALSDNLKAQLEQAAKAADHSIAEEIRRRLERSFEEDEEPMEPHLRELLSMIVWLKVLVGEDAEHEWFDDPAALSVFERAIGYYFGRLKASPPLDGEPLPVTGKIIQSADLETRALGLEAMAFVMRRGTNKMAPDFQELVRADLAKRGLK